MSELQRLRDRVEELEEALGLSSAIPVETLLYNLFPPNNDVGIPMLVNVFNFLLKRPFGRKEAMFIALYGARPECDQPNLQIINVYVSRIRTMLRKHGIKLKTSKTPPGWYIEEADKTKILEMLK